MPNREIFRITAVASLTVLLIAGAVLVLVRISHVILLLAIAIFVSLALEPGVTFLQRFFKSRTAAVGVMAFLVVLFLALFIASIVPPIATQAQNLINSLPELREDLEDSSTPLGALERRFEITTRLERVAKGTSEGISNLGDVFGTVFGIVADALAVLVLTAYFLLHAPKIKREGILLVPEKRRKRTASVAEVIFEKVGGWMEGNLLISAIAGVLSFAALLAFGVPYPAALAMWVAITDLIPLVGAMLGAIVCVAIAFFAGIVPGIATLIFFIVYQQVENYFIGPRIMKRTVDVSPVAVIVAALAGGTLLGPLGVLLAVPGAASLKAIAQEVWLTKKPS